MRQGIYQVDSPCSHVQESPQKPQSTKSMWLDVKDLHDDPTITHSFNHAWNQKLAAWTDSHQLFGRRKVHTHSEFFFSIRKPGSNRKNSAMMAG
jgi:hypothetical protein